MPLTNVFRTDGWVKTAQGPAVPGAQIWVCLQPANISSLPPTPLANIFSDVNGLVPITQPIITDGFGHYDFYTAAGVYTVIVGLAGIVQQVYLDQSIGGASGTQGGGTALVLQVNGAPASSQLLQNLQGAGSVTVSDAGAGNITITGAATVLPVFQTNGVPNTLQSLLNVKQGANISITSDALGGVTIAGATQGTTFGTSGQGFFAASGMTDLSSLFMYTFTAPITNTTANVLVVNQFVLQSSWTLSKVSYIFTTTSGAGSGVNFGIYNAAGVKVIDSGQFDGTSAAVQTLTFTPVTLLPGTYYFACSATDSTMRGVMMQTSNPTALLGTLCTSAPYIASAANPTSAGVMPATLGALTAITTSAYWEGIPLCIWKV